ncbi:hypothetical protein FIBSPDRAFT_903523 [Athelia psychrophila]|uniref:Uncharacterized protein n=1 Tax=Athelia psychrophila TaxID=1759441 RepID=A0A167VV44_9AGAM|nr:hypothetical protein FIBSPDRAFT_903523 [Fibularhizoctonia sp. CBS 109695]
MRWMGVIFDPLVGVAKENTSSAAATTVPRARVSCRGCETKAQGCGTMLSDDVCATAKETGGGTGRFKKSAGRESADDPARSSVGREVENDSGKLSLVMVQWRVRVGKESRWWSRDDGLAPNHGSFCSFVVVVVVVVVVALHTTCNA